MKCFPLSLGDANISKNYQTINSKAEISSQITLPSFSKVWDLTYGSDYIVKLLEEYGIEYIAANIGSTFRGLWESAVNTKSPTSPKCIIATHEEIAVAIAHGYAKASGKPMAVLLHDTVGLQHATMAIYNAWCDRVPIILLGSTGPLDATKRRPWIDWIHSSLIPNDLVRDYVKWDDMPMSLRASLESFGRAYNLSVTDPTAPVFVCFDTEYLEEKVDRKIEIPEKQPRPFFPSIDKKELEFVAHFLLEAEYPLIIAGTVGRNPTSVPFLVKIAEATGSRVLDTLDRFNFPNMHPLDCADKKDLSSADRILGLDVARLESVLVKADKSTRRKKTLANDDSRIIKIGLEDLLIRSWSSDYQGGVNAEQTIFADTSAVLPALLPICDSILKKDHSLRKKAKERIARASESSARRRASYDNEVKRRWNETPISPLRLASEVWSIVSSKSWVLANGTLSGWVRKIWEWNEPGCYLGTSGGAGLGYGLPASIGAAIHVSDQASKESKRKIVIDLQADGDFLYTSSALWTAAHTKVPLLIVMFNNRSYYNDAEHNKLIAEMRGRDEKHAFSTGGDIRDPIIDYATLARSFGIQAEGPVESAEDLTPALERAIGLVEQERRPALVDVVTSLR